MDKVWGGIEAGGTHFVCAVGSGPDGLWAEKRFSTTSPVETIGRAIAFFRSEQRHCAMAAIGIASFGPLDLDPASPTFGYVTSTTKPGWADTDIVGMVRRSLQMPVGLDTDVNGAALGEHLWGAAKGIDTFIYLTIGTGIGGGGMVNGRIMHGLIHPEMCHMRIPRAVTSDGFQGCCPYHGDCLQGLASGPAIAQRWGCSAESLPQNHPAWELEATYLATAVANLICSLSPQRIIIGGGVMGQPQLLPLVRQKVKESLGGYLRVPEILDCIDQYIVAPGLGRRAGVLGAIALGKQVTGDSAGG